VSPLVYLDRERCVLCARCTRFANEISDDPFIELFERGALEQVAIFEDTPYESAFSGNVIQICPVGALTSAEFRFKARPFDLTSAPSVCNHCASGCNLTVQTRRGSIVRVLARENPDVNEVWNCDKGRFGHAYVTRPERLVEPMVRKNDSFVAVSWAEAIRTIAERIDATKRTNGKAAVIAGARVPDEDAYMLSRFARTVLGTNDVDTRLRQAGPDEDAVLARVANAEPVTYADLEAAKLVIVAGLDPHEESPILFLRLRKASTNNRVPIVEIQPRRTRLAGSGARTILCVPGTEAGVLLALARRLGDAGAVAADAAVVQTAGASNATVLTERSGADPAAIDELAALVTGAGGDVVILAGERLASSSGALSAAWNLAAATRAKIGFVSRRAGAAGALWAGLHPTLLPAGRRIADDRERLEVEAAWRATIPTAPGRAGGALLDAVAKRTVDLLFLVAADPARDAADATLGRRAAEAGVFTVALDLLPTASTRHANFVLPAAAVPERAGTFTDWEGRAQPFAPGIEPAGLAQSDWEILAALSVEAAVAAPRTLQDLHREMRTLARPVARVEPVEPFEPELPPDDDAYPFSMVTYPLIVDDGTMLVGADDLLRTAAAPFVELNADDAVSLGISDGHVVTVASSAGRVQAPARITRGLLRGTVFVPANQEGVRAADLADAAASATRVRVNAGR
jgi:NADH-quinone oxidoreductase subunit G